jgi:hypothetical protein
VDNADAASSRPVAGPTPFELLHPAGRVERWAVLGGAPAAALSPARPPSDPDDGVPVDLLLLGPSRAESRDERWIAEAVARAGSIGADGLIVAQRPSRALAGALAASGLTAGPRLVHAPDVDRSRFVFPAGGREAGFAMRSLVSLSRPKRLAVRLMALLPLSPRLPVSIVFRRPGAAPLASWCAELAAPVPECTVVTALSWRPGGAAVAMRFSGGDAPDMVVKVGAAGAAEAEGLRRVAPGALRSHIAVPRLLSVAELDGRPLVAETPVLGRPASLVVDGSASRATRHVAALAERLGEWERTSAVRRPFTERDAERILTGPAGGLADALPEGYADALARACAALVGTVVPLVAAHRDTTASNVVVGKGTRIGLIDWEEATTETLPLGDLAYAIVDFAAASDGYRDRLAAYRQCFEPGGRFAATAGRLVDDAATALGLSAPVRSLALQACWLRHAGNELSETGTAGPFQAILHRTAAELLR